MLFLFNFKQHENGYYHLYILRGTYLMTWPGIFKHWVIITATSLPPPQIISFRKSLGGSDGWGLESRELSTSREHFRTEQKRVGGGGNLSPAQLAENTREQKKRVGGRRESVPSSTLTPLIHLSMRDLPPWNRKGQTISSSLFLLNRLSVEFLYC